MVNKKQLHIHIEDVEGYPEWKTIFIYKYKFLIDIIKSLPHAPQTPYEHWVLGKVFRYSEHAIEEFAEGRKVIYPFQIHICDTQNMAVKYLYYHLILFLRHNSCKYKYLCLAFHHKNNSYIPPPFTYIST